MKIHDFIGTGGCVTKKEGRRARILHILQLLWEKSYEEQPLSASDMVDLLEKQGILCDRKTIYIYWDLLEDFGFDVVRTKQGAYIGKRVFELPELKLLVDAVQASLFITEKKSRELIEKLSRQVSEAEGKQLRDRVPVNGFGKTENEQIYYNVDAIYRSILQNRKISFSYWNWNVKKEKILRQEGIPYRISPWALVYENEKYYLVGYDETAEQMKHFRVDKMQQIHLLCELRQGRQLYEKIDFSVYGMECFGMFQGRRETVTLRCDKDIAGVMIDHFGKNVWLHEDGMYCIAVVEVEVSNHFFGWIAGFAGKVRIQHPEGVKQEYRQMLERVQKGEEECI